MRANEGRTRLRRCANSPRSPWPENSRSQRSQRTEKDMVEGRRATPSSRMSFKNSG